MKLQPLDNFTILLYNNIRKNNLLTLRLLKTKALVFLLFINLISCTNDIDKINSFKNINNLPIESARNITMIRSDSGLIQLYMTSPQLDRYQSEQSFSKFPKGLKVIFYDENKNVKSKLSANYAINYEDRGLMEIKNNVIIIDIAKGDTIYTESLNWDQNIKKISSNVFVKKVNKDGILYGEGFDADESFNNYTLRRPRGTINLDKTE